MAPPEHQTFKLRFYKRSGGVPSQWPEMSTFSSPKNTVYLTLAVARLRPLQEGMLHSILMYYSPDRKTGSACPDGGWPLQWEGAILVRFSTI